MGLMIYKSGVDHRERAECHFRKVEKQMLESFKDKEQGYSSEVNEWILTLICEDEQQEINLMETCNWSVKSFVDMEMAVIRFDLMGKRHELIFAIPILFEEDKIKFMGMRRVL